MARFHRVPPSIFTERSATELMLEAIRRNEPLEPTAEQQGKAARRLRVLGRG
jgi:hypothetical protein